MGVTVKIGGRADWDASGVTVVEDALPLDPGDSHGGVGSLSVTVPYTDRSKGIIREPVVVTSPRGTTSGVVTAVGSASSDGRMPARGGDVQVAVLTRLAPLVTERMAAPHVGTLESLVRYYLGLCDVTEGVVVDESLAAIPVAVPGWSGNVWQQLKKLTAAYRFDIDIVGTDIVARPPRSNVFAREDESGFSWSVDESRMYQKVAAWFYRCAPITDHLVVGNHNVEKIVGLDAGEVHEFDVKLEASLSSVVQPVCVDSVSYGATGSVYSVLDANDRPVSAEMWRRNGGYVKVEINEDTTSVHVTVVGCQERGRAPYKLVAVAANKSEYSTLRIVGSGVSMKRERYEMPAAIDAAPELGSEDDNPFLGSWGHAHLALLGTAGRFGTRSQRISGRAWPEEPGQVFGNVAGARVFEDFNVYRIRTATISPTQVAYQAEPDATIDDVDALIVGRTFDEIDAVWAGPTFDDLDLRPLLPIPEIPVEVPVSGYGSGVYGGPPTYGG